MHRLWYVWFWWGWWTGYKKSNQTGKYHFTLCLKRQKFISLNWLTLKFCFCCWMMTTQLKTWGWRRLCFYCCLQMIEESRLDEETEQLGMNVQQPEAPSKFGKVFCVCHVCLFWRRRCGEVLLEVFCHATQLSLKNRCLNMYSNAVWWIFLTYFYYLTHYLHSCWCRLFSQRTLV